MMNWISEFSTRRRVLKDALVVGDEVRWHDFRIFDSQKSTESHENDIARFASLTISEFSTRRRVLKASSSSACAILSAHFRIFDSQKSTESLSAVRR